MVQICLRLTLYTATINDITLFLFSFDFNRLNTFENAAIFLLLHRLLLGRFSEALFAYTVNGSARSVHTNVPESR